MATHRYARINEANKVISITEVGDDITSPTSWLQKIYHTTNTFARVPGDSDKVGPGFSYDGTTFSEPQPYSTWTSTTSNNIKTWSPPVAVPTKVNNDQDPDTDTDFLYAGIFTWDNDNSRWLNGLGQYWDASNSNWVDI